MSRDIIRDNEGDMLDMDPTTGAIAVQTDLHKMSHRGLAWEITHVFTGVAAAASVDMFVEVPAGYELSADIEVSADQNITTQVIQVIAGTTGTAVNVNNLKSSSTNTPNTTFSHTPTGVSGSSQVVGPRFFTAAGAGASRSVFQQLAEIHLGEGLYIYRVTNNGAVAATINPALLCYEETA